MSEAPAGWYPDPAAPGTPNMRYWDGVQWTPHTHEPQPLPGLPSYVVEPTTPDGERLAGWWHRVGAAAIDGIFVAIANLILTLPHQVSAQRDLTSINDEFQRRVDANDPGAFSWYLHQMLHTYSQGAWWSLLPAVIAAIAIVCFLRLRGGSPGQLITGLRVRRRDRPGNLSWGRAIVRQLAAQTAVGVLAVIAMASASVALWGVAILVSLGWSLLDSLWAAWDPQRQTLHDKIAATNVVRRQK